MSGDPVRQSPEPAGAGHSPAAPQWGVSSGDWQCHAIDEDADHPDGVCVAHCGQRLPGETSLYDQAPSWMCLSCLRWTERWDTDEVTKPPPARPEREEGGAG